MPTRSKEWFSVVSAARLHGTEAVGRSVHSKSTVLPLCVQGWVQNKDLGAPCFYICVSKLVNLFTLSDVCAGQVFMWKELRERRPETVFLNIVI